MTTDLSNVQRYSATETCAADTRVLSAITQPGLPIPAAGNGRGIGSAMSARNAAAALIAGVFAPS
ncbi:hypothetical protein [Mycobacterium botniense]|uniref:hypothetical protein n=1 Tax=Mycobacterium botniense TaxID=84962 RepID=UPI0013D68988|nr:hypothetical protein [Mycobacterium botniense]